MWVICIKVDSLFLHWRRVMFNGKLKIHSFSYCFLTLLSEKYITIQYAFLIMGESAYQLVTGKWFILKSNTVFNNVLWV